MTERCFKCGKRTKHIKYFGLEGHEVPLCPSDAKIAGRILSAYVAAPERSWFLRLTEDQIEELVDAFRPRPGRPRKGDDDDEVK